MFKPKQLSDIRTFSDDSKYLKTSIMYEGKYKNKLGGNISILCEALAPYDALAVAPCVVCQCGSAISYKSGLNFTIVN